MRTEDEVMEELTAARAAYQARAEEMPVKESREASGKIRAIMQELSDVLSAGAEPCPECGAKPHGRHKSKFVYEICCLGCQRIAVDGPGGTIWEEQRIRRGTAAEAVEAWNAGERMRSAGAKVETVAKAAPVEQVKPAKK